MGNVTNFAVQKRTANSYPGAVRKADEFLAANAERIPDALHAKGIRAVLIHFAAKGVEGRVVMFALPDEAAPRPRSEFDLVCTLLAELPPLDGTTGSTNAAASVELADDALHQAAEKEIAAAWTGRGEKIDYATAVHRAAEKHEAAIHPPDVDPKSEELDSAARAEIEAAWKLRGERLPYFDALRLAETKRNNR